MGKRKVRRLKDDEISLRKKNLEGRGRAKRSIRVSGGRKTEVKAHASSGWEGGGQVIKEERNTEIDRGPKSKRKGKYLRRRTSPLIQRAIPPMRKAVLSMLTWSKETGRSRRWSGLIKESKGGK